MTTQLIEGRVKLTQEIDQFGSDIHDLETHLNKKIDASEAQLPFVMDDDQLVEQKEEFQPFNYTLFLNIDVDKEYKSENVVNNAAMGLRQLESHSKHFSVISELMDECIDEEQGPYILMFFSPRRQNDIPHLRAKKCKMRHKLLGSFIFIPPPLERSRKIDAKFWRSLSIGNLELRSTFELKCGVPFGLTFVNIRGLDAWIKILRFPLDSGDDLRPRGSELVLAFLRVELVFCDFTDVRSRRPQRGLLMQTASCFCDIREGVWHIISGLSPISPFQSFGSFGVATWTRFLRGIFWVFADECYDAEVFSSEFCDVEVFFGEFCDAEAISDKCL
ncbi:hypothetical protein H5410_046884 [Solanum commersonii]|uniref:Uncharacterized protein n=1 Tax=Solanum commersonii TaxID=4109 RepID=A0A9J5XFM4_SOLCO|nr:hypothetical protein H5410_046884 [Solanum commersonii]